MKNYIAPSVEVIEIVENEAIMQISGVTFDNTTEITEGAVESKGHRIDVWDLDEEE